MATATVTWYEANQRYLAAALARVQHILSGYVARVQGQATAAELPVAEEPRLTGVEALPAIESLCQTFGLSPFERDLLLLCAGVELDANVLALCAAAQGNSQQPYPTFGLALAALPDAHWSALTPIAPLRHWRLIEIGAGHALTHSPLRIDERVLHYLAGTPHPDQRLAGMLDPISPAQHLVPSHQAVVEQISALWSQSVEGQPLPVILLYGADSSGRQAVAQASCSALGLRLSALSADLLPTNPGEIETLARLWEREAALSGSALLLDWETLDAGDHARRTAVTRLIERISGALLVASRERRQVARRLTVSFEVRTPDTGEQRAVWQYALGTVAERLDGQIDRLVSQFNLSTQAIQVAATDALRRHALQNGTGNETPQPDTPSQVLLTALWEACRVEARPRLEDLAQRIESVVTWDDLVLPAAQQQILRDIAAHVRQRVRVYDTWGFAAKGTRGLGISALFAGASGTGKTLAAEVLANELRLDLYRIDLSAVVSKYIGETEKNLRQIFDAAEAGGAILLFDEADALFGKRSEVKDSHDRYANIEVSYLLQRMEAYRGLAILTTNLKSALDTAFLRRIRFVVQFPFPDAVQRGAIWRRVFPPNTPTARLQLERLAQLNVAGGNIRNIALNAAFLAADADDAVRMEHVLRAARSEYAKLEKPLTDAEIVGWE